MIATQALGAPKEIDPGNDLLIRASRLLFVIGLFFTSLLVIRVGGALTLGDLLLGGSLVLSLMAVKRPRFKWRSPAATLFLFALLVAGGGLAANVAVDAGDNLATLGRIIFVALILPWQARTLLDTPKRMARALMSFALGAAVCGLGTLAQAYLGPTIIPGSAITTAGRFAGFTAHVSDTGGISCLAVVFGFAALGRAGNKLVSLFILASGVVGLVLSGSVSGMLAAAIGILVVLAMRGVSFFRLFLIAGAAAAGLSIANAVLASVSVALDPAQRILQVFGVTGNDMSQNTSASRWQTDVLGWEGFLESPFVGAGLDTESSIVMGTLPVHNFFLASLYQGGIFMTIALVVIIIGLLARGLRAKSGPLHVVIVAMAITTLVFAMTAPSFFNRYFWIPMAFLGVQAALHSRGVAVPIPKEKKQKGPKLSPAYAELSQKLAAKETT